MRIAKIEAKGFQDFCNYVKSLEEENKLLKNENKKLKKQYDEFYEKEYMKRIDECNELWAELFDIKHMNLCEFAEKYCKDEHAGQQLAKSLGVGL